MSTVYDVTTVSIGINSHVLIFHPLLYVILFVVLCLRHVCFCCPRSQVALDYVNAEAASVQQRLVAVEKENHVSCACNHSIQRRRTGAACQLSRVGSRGHETFNIPENRESGFEKNEREASRFCFRLAAVKYWNRAKSVHIKYNNSYNTCRESEGGRLSTLVLRRGLFDSIPYPGGRN